MKTIKLDQDKLLGFKILKQTPKVGGKTDMMAVGKIGEKTGVKPGRLGAKLGAKVGGKGV